MYPHSSRNSTKQSAADIVQTCEEVALEIIHRYPLSGKVLDPCRGESRVFWKNIPGADWCEILEGRDFFDYNEPVDWVIGNPPYSIFNKWFEHSAEIAKNIAYLIPIAKLFGSQHRMSMVQSFGGIVEIYAPWTGRQVGFEFGWPVGSVYVKKGYRGDTRLFFGEVAEMADCTGPENRQALKSASRVRVPPSPPFLEGPVDLANI